MFKNLRKKKKGFTLIELIIVIAIMAILAAVAVPKFGEVREKAALKADVANAKIIADATSALIVEGEDLTGPYIIDPTNDGTNGADKNEIEKYLQNTPKPESKKYTQYKVTITNENVTVSMTGGTSVNEKPLYPNIPVN